MPCDRTGRSGGKDTGEKEDIEERGRVRNQEVGQGGLIRDD